MSITNKLNQIKNAIYGKEVRGAIHDAIKQVYDDATVNHDNANMEVKMARGTHNTLNDRLDNVDEIQAQTNAQLSHINDKLEVNIKDYKLESDSTYDDAFKRCSIANPYATIRFNDGDYPFKNQINITTDNNLLLDANARIYATSPVDCLINYETTRTINSLNDLSINRFIRGGIIDGNNLAKNGLKLNNYRYFELDTSIKNIQEKALITNGNGKASAELMVKKLLIENEQSHPNSVGIYNSGNDNHFSDVIIVNFKTGLHDLRSGRFFRVHAWIHNKDLLESSVAFKSESFSDFICCYADTFQYGFEVSKGAKPNLSYCTVFYNKSVYTDDMAETYPVRVINIDRGGVNCESLFLNSSLSTTAVINDATNSTMTNTRFMNISSYTHKAETTYAQINSTNAFKEVYKAPGFELMSGTTSKGYIATSSNSVQMTNSTSKKNISLLDDGRAIYDNEEIMLKHTSRPQNPRMGQYYFDQTLRVPLFYRGDVWVRADGTAV